jgi:DNA processing protein
MNYTEHAINVLATRTYKGIGRAWIVRNLSHQKDQNEIVDLLNREPRLKNPVTLDDFQKRKNFLQRRINESKEYIDGVVAIGDDNFPSHRGEVINSEKPVFLFYRGNLSLLDKKNNNVAVIGLLNPDSEIESIEKEIVASLVKYGATILSGLALGCDTIAHIQALESKGSTIAVLPSPLASVVPAKNKELSDKITDSGGLVVAEYLTNPKSKRELVGRYQERDRLQALFSNVVLLSASYSKNDQGNDSGSRLAMNYASKYSIKRAVIYAPEIHSGHPKYALNRQILEEDPRAFQVNYSNIVSVVKELVLGCVAATTNSAKNDT